jgi:hypothetical protein
MVRAVIVSIALLAAAGPVIGPALAQSGFDRPGYGVTVAHCYLKDTIKPPRHRPCCISGVVR